MKKLEEADRLRASGLTVPDACRQIDIAPATYHQWRKKYRGMDVPQAKRLKELEKENQRLKEMVAEMALDNRILKMAAEGLRSNVAMTAHCAGVAV